MKKRSLIAWVAVIMVCIIAALVWWFWSLGSLPADNASKLQLVIEKGNVFVTKDGMPEEQVNSGMEIEKGDRIRTAENSIASLMSYSKASIRLDAQTTMTITNAQDNQDAGFVMNFKLESGRAWSRVLHLLDLRDDFSGQSNQVIATVRGTAFGLVANGQTTDVVVDQAGVGIVNGQSDSKEDYLVGGEWAEFNSSGKLTGRGDVASGTWRDQDWLKENQDADKNYSSSSEAAFAEGLHSKNGSPPDSWSYGLSLWSENLHLAFAGKNAPKLWAKYFGRRIGYVHDLIDRGKSGFAFQMLSDIDKELNSKLNDTKSKDYRVAVRPILGDAMLAFSSVEPTSNAFRLKLGVEDMYAGVWNDDAASFYARSLSVDARLDEAERFDCQPNVEDLIKEAVNAVEQGLAREKGDLEKMSAITAKDKATLNAKVQVQTLRLDFFKRHLAMCASISIPALGETGSTTSTTQMATSTDTAISPSKATSTVPVTPPVVATSTQNVNQTPPAAQSLGLVRIQLMAQPSPANVGDRVKLFVNGYKVDGSFVDVTDRANFGLVGNLGTISGSTYVASAAGSVTINATVVDSGQTLIAGTPLSINQGVILSSISISPASGSINIGGSLPLTVVANYSNGFSKDVSSSVAWSVSNALARMAGASLVAGATPGAVTVTASYSDLGVTKTTAGNYQIIQTAAVTTFLQ
ncbi:MAG: FecR domain-containing protein [Patescibacteria group bacterium]|nr:FecR domain-containing protein [Patescibacteria group bacterium]